MADAAAEAGQQGRGAGRLTQAIAAEQPQKRAQAEADQSDRGRRRHRAILRRQAQGGQDRRDILFAGGEIGDAQGPAQAADDGDDPARCAQPPEPRQQAAQHRQHEGGCGQRIKLRQLPCGAVSSGRDGMMQIERQAAKQQREQTAERSQADDELQQRGLHVRSRRLPLAS